MTTAARDAKRMSLRLPSRRRGLCGMVLMAVALAGGAAAQAPARRPGVERQTVVQLAYTLGEAHALRRLCAGPADATWYARMQRLEDEEAVDEGSRRQLVEAFNAGYGARLAQFPACSRRSRAAEHGVAAKGAELAQRLASP